jgi:hypothetical protein
MQSRLQYEHKAQYDREAQYGSAHGPSVAADRDESRAGFASAEPSNRAPPDDGFARDRGYSHDYLVDRGMLSRDAHYGYGGGGGGGGGGLFTSHGPLPTVPRPRDIRKDQSFSIPSRQLFVGNINFVREPDIAAVFSQYGAIDRYVFSGGN